MGGGEHGMVITASLSSFWIESRLKRMGSITAYVGDIRRV